MTIETMGQTTQITGNTRKRSMKLHQLLTAHPPTIDLAGFCRRPPSRMKPLASSAVSLTPLVGEQTRGRLIEGDAALLLQYKQQDVSVTSLAEHNAGERWHVLQLQGLRSRKSFRAATCFAVIDCFAAQLRAYMAHPDAEVRIVTMPAAHGITNIDGAQDYESAVRKYEMYAAKLGLQYSEEAAGYIADVRALLHAAVSG